MALGCDRNPANWGRFAQAWQCAHATGGFGAGHLRSTQSSTLISGGRTSGTSIASTSRPSGIIQKPNQAAAGLAQPAHQAAHVLRQAALKLFQMLVELCF